MPGNRFKDFDEARAARDPIEFRIRGRDYKLADDPDAESILTLLESGADLDDPKVAIEIIRQFVGEEIYAQLITDHVTITELMQLLFWIMGQCGLDVDKEEANNGPPVSTPKRSSKTGRR